MTFFCLECARAAGALIVIAKVYARVIMPSLARIDPALPDNAARSPLGKAWRQLDSTLDAIIHDSALAA